MALVAGADEVTGIVVVYGEDEGLDVAGEGGWGVHAVALKMSTTFEMRLYSAQGMSHRLTISAAPSSSSRIPPHKLSHPASAQTNTTNTYHHQHSHQRRKRVQRSAAMWPQDHIEPR